MPTGRHARLILENAIWGGDTPKRGRGTGKPIVLQHPVRHNQRQHADRKTGARINPVEGP